MLPTKLVESGSISEAVQDTFSGEYPCEMCELAALKRSVEQKQSTPIPGSSEKKSDKASPLISFISKAICIYPPKRDKFPNTQHFPRLNSLATSPETPPPDTLTVWKPT